MMPFVLGFVSGVLAVLVVLLSRVHTDKARAPRRWTQLTSFQYHWDFEYESEGSFTSEELCEMLPRMMRRLSKDKPMEPVITIDGGAYSVDLTLHARFVHRERDPT